MPDLRQLLDIEAQAQAASTVPPFGLLVSRRRRRRRVRTGLTVGVLAAGAVALGAVALAGSPTAPVDRLATSAEPVVTAPITICRPRELDLSLTWEPATEGPGLRGTLTAHNGTDHPCLLLVKPSVQPDNVHGSPLPTQSLVTMEGLIGPDELLPGGTATAPISWFTWCGADAGRTAHVSWTTEGHAPSAQVTATGQVQPPCIPQPGSNQLSSSWFTGLSPRSTATVSGVLRFVGGPCCPPPHGVPGTVTLRDSNGFPHVTSAGRDGRFSLELQPGISYTATATSPQYNSGHGTCGVEKRVYVPAEGLTDLTVNCQLK